MVINAVYPVLMASSGQPPVTVTFTGDAFHWLSPVTGNTVVLDNRFGPVPKAAYARMRVLSTVMTTDSALFRVVVTDDGPTNYVVLGYLRNSAPGSQYIANDIVDFTGQFNMLFGSLVLGTPPEKSLGWQLAGDNTHPVIIHNVRFEIGWMVPSGGGNG